MGFLEGRISPENLHEGSLFNNGSWIMPFEKDKAFSWRKGDKVRFKILKAGILNHIFRLDQRKRKKNVGFNKPEV